MSPATVQAIPESRACSVSAGTEKVYQGRKPRESPLWQIVEKHFDEFLRVYDERFAPTYGPLRASVRHAVEAFRKCGILDWGFARVRCPECRHEYLLPFSCKRRCLCPSCHKKRQIEFGEFVAGQILYPVAHRHMVLSLPRRLRPHFRRRRRLAQLARAAYETIKDLLQIAGDTRSAVPGAVACIQSYGSLLDWHPHIHLLSSWGLFTQDGTFLPVDATPGTEDLEKLFRHKVLRLLQDEGTIDEQVVANLLAWPHTGFGAHLSREIPADPVSRENVARYLAHPPIVLDRIVGDPSAGKILYTGEVIHPRHRANFRVFDPVTFLAALCAHIPDPRAKTAIYCGWYSNRTRGFRQAHGLLVPVTPVVPVTEADHAPLGIRRTWARLIRKIYTADPLRCPRCGATMRVIAVIDQEEVIYRILSHLNLLSPGDGPRAPPPRGPSAAPATPGRRELIYEPVFEDLPWPESA